jgi:diguanylate cyclase (GGDEF)-like protein
MPPVRSCSILEISRQTLLRLLELDQSGTESTADVLAAAYGDAQYAAILQAAAEELIAGRPDHGADTFPLTEAVRELSPRVAVTLGLSAQFGPLNGKLERQARLALARRTWEDHVQARRSLEELREKAFRDPLTGLYNRAFLEECLRTRAEEAARVRGKIGVLFVDVDGLKAVNDTHGHAAGDALLCHVADRLAGSMRAADVPARGGGDEFLVLVSEASEHGLRRVATRVRETVCRDALPLGDHVLPVSVSIGAAIAVPSPGDASFASRLIRAADAAMYDAKRAANGNICLRRAED